MRFVPSDNPVVDVIFPLFGSRLPLDHGYALFGALARVIPALHEEPRWGVHPVAGVRCGDAELAVTSRSRVMLRVPLDDLRRLSPLAGAVLDVDGWRLHLGLPQFNMIAPKDCLWARLVTIKGFLDEPATFAEALRRQIAASDHAGPDLSRVEVDVGRRRVLRIKDRTVVGFSVGLRALDEQTSLRIQYCGLGGRRHMGAGIFVPSGRQG